MLSVSAVARRRTIHPAARSLRHALLASAAGILLMGAAGAPAWGADGDGGVSSDGTAGGSASFTSTGGAGASGQSTNVSGSGGGAGAQGGSGGWGWPFPGAPITGDLSNCGCGSAGMGGNTPGASGGNGGEAEQSGWANGGGGGGAHGYVGSIGGLSGVGSVQGGSGGMGGETNGLIDNNNGGGGGGGFGAVITGLTGNGGTIGAPISAGNGGTTGYRTLSGGGGNGGTGLLFLQPSGDNVVTLSAGASVQGGAGGAGMTRAGDAGTGLIIRDGTGNNTFNLAGTISGGDENYIFNSHIGGNGGNGIAVVNMNGLTTLNISGNVTGGSGGEGFTTAGNGGVGITGNNLAINADGSQGLVMISGGAGATFFAAGLGGAGIIGADLAIVLTGQVTVAGGANGIAGSDGWSGQAAAIDFTGGTNSLELQASDAGVPILIGDIVHAGANDTLILSGSGAGSVDTSLIEGFGTFVKEGSSTWTLTGLPVYSVNSWTFNGGTVSISGNVFGASAPILLNGATLATTGSLVLPEPIGLQGAATFSPAASTSLILSGELSGSSALTKVGAGALILSGANAGYAGPVTLAAGTLGLTGIGGLPGATSWTLNGGNLDLSQRGSSTSLQMVSGTGAQSDINVGSTDVTLVQPANASYAGTFSGTGSLTKTGAGALVLTGDSPFTGTTTIAEGTLQLGDGGTSGWLAGAIVNNGTLAINRSDNVTISNTITGPGALLLQGGGTVSFASTYSGSLSAVGSSIHLDGTSLANASLALESGAVLSGNGAVGNLTVLSSGVVAPGNSPGTLTVNGPVLFSSGSVYRVDATPTGAHDLITASGEVTLLAGSAVQVVAAPGSYAANTTYTILTTSDAVNGTFGSVSSNYAFLSPSLTYDAQNVYLTLTYTGTQFASLAQTANHASVAGSAQGLGFGNEVFDTLLLLPESAVPGALDALSGDTYGSVNTVIQQQSIYVREAVGDRLRQALTAPGVSPLAYGAGPQTEALGEGLTPTLWMQGYGGWGDTASDGNAASISNSVGGFLMGADIELAPNVRAGLFGGFSQSWFDVDDRNASGSMDSYDIGIYAGAQFGAIALRGGAAYAWNDVSVSRTVSFPGLWQALEADYTTGTTQIFGEIGYDMAVGAYAFEPFAGLAYVHVGGAEFTETGGSAALAVSTDSMATLYSTLGLRVATTLEVGGRTLTPHATIGWQHAFGDITPDASLAFTEGSTPFTAAGVPIAEDTLLLEAGLRYALSDTTQLGASYSGQFGDGATQNAFTVNFSMKF